MITHEKRRDRFIGTLIGCAVGDALGAPFEGKTREAIALIDGLTDAFRPYRSYSAGQYTDDTQQTIAIAKSIIAVGQVDGAAIASEFVQLWESGEIVGAGPVAKRAVERLMAGVPWMEAALPEDLAYNGTAMRVSPIGLWNYDRSNCIAPDARISSIVTHRHPAAIAGAIAIATAVAYAINHTEIQAADFLNTVSESIIGEDTKFAGQIQRIEGWLGLEETVALEQIASVSENRIFALQRDGFGISVFVVPTVLMSLYAFLKSPQDYIATVERAIRAGGDVDSTAAIAGAISGAHNGIDAIPAHLVRGVKDSDQILASGNQLFEAKFAKREL